ncbi:hypothetical protein HW450_05065 [Corynebacterium hindlerae]|uniref:Uncharacterized protein n=1 Tax=Corynebacterium hindlerae TaxID=699041 RepID=A0A7G5FHJ7_9CORY|nr:hypothetical protein [Corynebacterium hindlerae]QMV86088.1 hypothetical protein HW450_05065 [Corynebacterium hindlerae]
MGKVKKAQRLYDEAIESLRVAAGADWNGPAHSSDKVAEALNSTAGIDTNELRKKQTDITSGGRATGVKNGRVLPQIGAMLVGIIGGAITETLISKAWDWIASDEKAEEFGEDTTKAADRLDDVEKTTGECAEKLCSETKSTVSQLCSLLRMINKEKHPREYRAVLSAADSLINQCGSGVIGIAAERDTCVSDIYNQLIQRGSEICGEDIQPVPLACEQPVECPPAPPCDVAPASAPPAPAPAPAPAGPAPGPAPATTPAATPPAPPTAPEVSPAPTAPPVQPATVEPPVEKLPEPTFEPKTPAPVEPSAVEPPAVKDCEAPADVPEEPADCETETDTPECDSSPLSAVLGIGIMVAIIGVIITALEECVAAPEPEAPPAAEPPPPVAEEPPPPPKQHVPPPPVAEEPPPPPKQHVPPPPVAEEPPPPPKQHVPPPPVAEEPPVVAEPPPAPEPELASSGVARKAGAW